MKHLFAAIRFLTILPAGKEKEFNPGAMLPFFPIVGLILGILLMLLDFVISRIWPGPAAAILDVLFLTLVTGGLHLDGLGDAADGLYGRRTREKALAIMKDSRLGAMGAIAIFLCLAVKWAGIHGLEAHRALFLFIIPAYARGAALFGIRFLEYGRSEGGTGSDFFKQNLPGYAFAGLAFPVLLSLTAGFKGLFVILVFGLTVGALLFYYRRKIGCITGDMLGAMIEITEAALFLAAAARL